MRWDNDLKCWDRTKQFNKAFRGVCNATLLLAALFYGLMGYMSHNVYGDLEKNLRQVFPNFTQHWGSAFTYEWIVFGSILSVCVSQWVINSISDDSAKEKEERVELLRRQIGRRMMNSSLTRGWSAWYDLWAAKSYALRRLREVANRLQKPEV